MRRIGKLLTINGRIILTSLFVMALLQGCVEKGAVMIDCSKAKSGSGKDLDGGGACNPPTQLTAPANQPASGFVGISGPNPVGAGITCNSGNLCNPSGQRCGFNTFCKNTYTYPAGGGSGGVCACACLP